MDYTDFLATKRLAAPSVGLSVSVEDLHPALFPFQRDLVRWSLRKGRAALFADTGLGKTLMQLDWARHAARATNGAAIILAPLAVARQTVTEGERFGIPVTYARSMAFAAEEGITITNYEMMEHFDPRYFGAVVLDESSILKSIASKTRGQLIQMFERTPMRLCCTATPAPNDVSELANHSEFLGVMSRSEMLASFFVNDAKIDQGGGWRIKRHAAAGPFWQWLASWGMYVRQPSDIGHSDEGFALPNLSVNLHTVECDYVPTDRLIFMGATGITEHAQARHGTLTARVEAVRHLVANDPDEQWLIWCDYNDEDEALRKAIPTATVVRGSQSPEQKADSLIAFAKAELPILITKPSIAGFGLNLQKCARMVFCGLSFSWESYYQAIRRCWRFGQHREVEVHVVLSTAELDVWNAIQRKEQAARRMATELVKHVAEFEKQEIGRKTNTATYQPSEEARIPSWLK